MQIRITKIFHFSMAHALTGYDGKCRNLHGHNYKLEVTLSGKPITDTANAKNGMVVDFGDVRRIVDQHVIQNLDHALMLPHGSPITVEGDTKLLSVSFQPTVENILCYIAQLLEGNIPQGLELYSLRLYESDSSYGELIVASND